ncbi:uncharacterized protein LOC143554626 [Bidens hawaiensis]|uniref:uncharacterized protein LOC143554626 n=1 Tax=Bidens hawaiensis TaxID=980011 RepID=UPI00404B1C50
MCPQLAHAYQAQVVTTPYYATHAHQAQVIPTPYYSLQAYQVQTYQAQVPQVFAPAYVPQVPQLMVPPSASTHVFAIQSRPYNQVAQAPQGSNGCALMMNVKQAQSSSTVVNGAEKSFIYLDFSYVIAKPQDKLSKPFSIEVAYGNSIVIDSEIWDCVITLNKVKFRIDLIPMQMGSFDVIFGMDWLTLYRAEVTCFEKFLRIPLKNGCILNVFNNMPTPKLNLMSCFQAQRYLRKKYVTFIALVVEKEHNKKKIFDILVVRDFPKVFPDDVSGLPPIR